MDGFELAARFSYITNALQYCGPHLGHKDFKKYMIKSEESLQEAIRGHIKRFEALYPYLKFIGDKHKLDFMDYKVVEAYWIGNNLLDSFTKEDMNKLIGKLVGRGLPKSMGDSLIARMPKGAVPSHGFHVTYVGVGNVTGHVKTTVQNMDNCRISAGKIVQIIDDKLIVATDTLRQDEKGIISVVPNETKTIVYDHEMLPGVGQGDYVAIHWGFACKKLDKKELESIQKYTKLAFDAANSARK